MRSEFVTSIKTHQSAFGLDIADDAIERLADYYGLIQEHNEFLHLVGPATAAEFATRHILESLTLTHFLRPGARFADIGAGGGLPSIPCLLVREDLRAVLIETKEKKAKFLDMAVESLQIDARAEIVNRQFQEVDPANCEAVTCRALDKFTEKLPRLLIWAKQRQLLFFGGKNLGDALQEHKVKFVHRLMPLSERRYLFISDTGIRPT